MTSPLPSEKNDTGSSLRDTSEEGELHAAYCSLHLNQLIEHQTGILTCFDWCWYSVSAQAEHIKAATAQLLYSWSSSASQPSFLRPFIHSAQLVELKMLLCCQLLSATTISHFSLPHHCATPSAVIHHRPPIIFLYHLSLHQSSSLRLLYLRCYHNEI